MMNDPEVTLAFNENVVGVITFPTVRQLFATRAMDGLLLTIPAEIDLKINERVAGRTAVLGIRATTTSFGEHVGIAEDCRVHVAKCKTPLSLTLPLPALLLHHLERRRNAGDIVMSLQIETRLCVLRDAPLFRAGGAGIDPVVENGKHVLRSVQGEPFLCMGSATVTLGALAWANMLTVTGFGENVFVEIPIPPSPGPPWDEVWRALRAARESLTRGGTTGWKSVIMECRTALEKWREIEEPDLGPGPNAADRMARTWDQRLDQLRWHLHHLTHDAIHGHADECTRDEAVLVLATLAGLLATRKP